MSRLKRFGVSIEEKVLKNFDSYIKKKKYPTRSKAISDLIVKELVKHEWLKGNTVVGVISLVYNHHKRDIVEKLTDIQHDFYDVIISSQHIHLDHNNCFEIVIVRGKPDKIKNLSEKLAGTKGVKYSNLTAAITGKNI
ncbi:MAG: nickel-responsive transcriptional regulator NikR [Elusimicrobia bacterium]|nr:nickel-responsive transcriptional regulator NikR [Elusimicrobiota bacterium]